MASLGLTQEELKSVEQARQRLYQLTNSLLSLSNNVWHSNPLPTLESIQASADILQLNMRALLDIARDNNELFSRVAVHPSTNFPGRTQENVLGQLLRKKAEPSVETRMEEGRKTLDALPTPRTTLDASTLSPAELDALKRRELESVWEGVREACTDAIIGYAQNAGKAYTDEERAMGVQNVRTGLRQVPVDTDDEDDDEDEEDEEDEDVMEIDRPPPPPAPEVNTAESEGTSLENIMRFAAKGQFGS
ncbi:mediator of RNA polymerase II transcription complex subunit 8-domain-containing protein [Xylariaceae sp. FL0016]|nr:mediator of RNA polymerase II transcription complex subunit 8-domain-containing protein [Xylariaceae sp. FL0016]